MNFPSRRTPLGRSFCCGLASLIVGACAVDAAAQEPLRVDPALLGLPPLQPAEPSPAAAVPPAPVKRPESVDVRPVEGAAVETRPIEPAAAAPVPAPPPRQPPPAASAPAASSAVSAPPSAPLPPAPTPPTAAPAAPQLPLANMPPPATARAPQPTSSAAATSLPPLSVDPALLGYPAPRPPSTAKAAPATTPAGAERDGTPTSEPRDDVELAKADAQPALALRPSRTMQPPPKDSTAPPPTFLSAQRMGGEVERELVAEGEVELRRTGTVLTSDRLTYWPIEDEVEAEGSVRFEQGLDRVTGPKMRLRIEDQVGFFEQPSYTLKRGPQAGSQAEADKAFAEQFRQQQSYWNSGFAAPPVLRIAPGQTMALGSTKPDRVMTEAHGDADRIDFEGENQVRLTNSTYTTCAPGNDDWYVKTGELKLDYDREVADGKHATVYFKEVPIFYSPWLTFSLNRERKSGFLTPSIGTTSNSGLSVTQPYYWNIAPNMDATISPNLMSKRGLQVSNEFRYLNTAYGGIYHGEARLEVLPGDRLRDGDNRYGLSLLHTQTTANRFSAAINYNRVSDDNYYTDLSSRIANTSQTQLLQQAVLGYTGAAGWWSATANFQAYQTLQPDLQVAKSEQYRMLPQVTVNARRPDWYFTDSSFMGQHTAFLSPDDRPDAQRTVLYPQVALPYVTPGWYVTPKLGVNVRHYAISGQAAGSTIPDSITSTLPIFSVDSGMTFERPSNWFGREYTQTLEPRLYYVNIPYRDQSNIPLFDSSLADFNFAQIFSENLFAGWDRINNANQLTAAVTSRLLDPTNGNEIMRAMLGQRLYFTRNRVNLTTTVPVVGDDREWARSDFLAAFSGQVLPKVYADTAVQYNAAENEVKRFSVGARYQPEPGKVLNAAYRYNRDTAAPINQVDVSGQWPLSGRWHAVGRLNYSFKDEDLNSLSGDQGGRLIESIGGLEYNGGCWVVRSVVQRRALTQQSSSTSFFVQLELNDFASIGSNPLSILKRNIPGYGLINQPAADPDFGQ